MGVYNDEKRQNLDKYEDESEREDVRYIFLPFVAFLPFRKESNRLIDMGERIKSLNHLVYIPKIGLSYNC